MAEAMRQISGLFPDIRWGEAIRTEAEGETDKRPYLNKAAIFHTQRPCDEVIRLFKGIEQACGRTAEKKRLGIIPIDIDLLTYGDTPVKPADLAKSYVKQAFGSIPT